MLQEIFQPIQTKIDQEGLFKYISEDWGQLDYYGKDCPVQWPCCVFDIVNGQFSNIGKLEQEGEINLVFKVAHLRLTPNSARTSVLQQEQSWEVVKIVEKLHKALQGFKPHPQHGKLIRKQLRKVQRDDGIKQYEIIYTIGLHNV
ncbi:hypothetical protein HX017_15415 [Myroides marinus]|uniref:hypothetical protein n=1 Tax=Myroides TaxID=76831 RepID=UPI0025757981|nr:MULTISPECIES: hypothetical protein [Myroides]MDM1033809.1 hypothetical protein [Myroides odoratimimus]MDM1366329.1 hypothetical protein [Myroides marinus]